MTRADLINSLGVGRLTSTAVHAARHLSAYLGVAVESSASSDACEDGEEFVSDSDNDDDDDDDSDVAMSSSSDAGDDGRPLTTTPVFQNNKTITAADSQEALLVPCRASDIGGFYSALCTLGIGINIGTKVSSMNLHSISVHCFFPRRD